MNGGHVQVVSGDDFDQAGLVRKKLSIFFKVK
jgi:hypothetical protein